MKVLGISGSSVKRGSYFLLEKAIEAVDTDIETEIVHLADLNINACEGCNSCLKDEECSIKDDLNFVIEKMLDSDALIIASPTYFASVSGILKTFMDRTRYLKMHGYILKDKYLGAITTSGLSHGGGQSAVEAIHRFGLWHGMIVVSPLGKIGDNMVIGTLEGEGGWRSIKKDSKAITLAENLGERVSKLIS